jgi:hypothetical protein
VRQRREQVDLVPAWLPGATQRLAIHRDRATIDRQRPVLVGQPAPHDPVQLIGVQLLQHTAQRGLARGHMPARVRPLPDPQPRQRRLWQLLGELPDRGERPGTGQHRRGGDRQQPSQRVPPPTPRPGIAQLPQALQQPTRTVD